MALWSGVGQVANIAQLTGVDAYGLISMIVEAAKTVKRNRETCHLLARRVRMIGDLLKQFESSQLMQHMETRNPMEQLEETLRHAYMLIASCRGSSYLHNCFMGGKQAEQFHEVQNEITFYLQLFPLVSFVDTTRTLERIMNSDHPSWSEETADLLHTVHHSEYNDRLRAKDLETIKFKSLEKSRGEQTKVYSEETASLIGGGIGPAYFSFAQILAATDNFSFSQILAATDNLSHRNLVGDGGFGYVYKGKLSNGLNIAIKRHDSSSFQGPEEFRTEIEVIPNLRHKNIIALLGCCRERGEKILVYEYMPNKSLASVLSDETKRELLNWFKRLQIIKSIADGLAYLHEHSYMRIVHRDIKSSNILLDHKMNAKISDFGLAILLAPNTTAEVAVIGTYGYADPYYVATGRISEKADVYSFGVVLLEIVSGQLLSSRKVKMDPTHIGMLLPDYVHKHPQKMVRKHPKKLVQKLVDPLLGARKHERAQIMQCIKVALLCIHRLPERRPSMAEVVAMLSRIQVVRM